MSINLLKLLIAMYPFLKEVILYGAKTPKTRRFRKILFVAFIILVAIFIPDSIVKYGNSIAQSINPSHQYLLDNNNQMKTTIALLESEIDEMLDDLERVNNVNQIRSGTMKKLSLKIAKLNTALFKCSKPAAAKTSPVPSSTDVYDRMQEFNYKYRYK